MGSIGNKPKKFRLTEGYEEPEMLVDLESIRNKANKKGYVNGNRFDVERFIKENYPDHEVKIASAEGLEDCRKLLTLAKAGKYDGYLLEGMACPGGCVAGAGTIQPIAKSAAAVANAKKTSTNAHSSKSNYKDLLDVLIEN